MDFNGYTIIDFWKLDDWAISFQCKNCGERYSDFIYQNLANENGIACFWYEDTVFQIIKCSGYECPGVFVLKSPVQNPAIDMSAMIMVPHDLVFDNLNEQIRFIDAYKSWPHRLKFHYIKAWDEIQIPDEDAKSLEFQTPPSDYLFTLDSEKQIIDVLEKAKRNGTRHFQRFIPRNKVNEALVVLSAHTQRTSIESLAYPPEPADQFKAQLNAFYFLLKYYSGSHILKAIKQKLDDFGITETKELGKQIFYKIQTKLRTTQNDLYKVRDALLNHDYKRIEDYFKTCFDDIFYPLCTENFLSKYRQKLLGWVDEVETGTALFVDAPMGIGKTYSIIQGLINNQDASAVIFMPTKRLCQELRYELAYQISLTNKMLPTQEEKIPVYMEGYEIEIDEYGDFKEQYTENYYRNRGVYLFDGINDKECPSYEKIIERYGSGYYRKADICAKCPLENCRFLNHRKVSNDYRILITTHHMYDYFYSNAALRKYHTKNDDGEIKKNLRDYFIIDEDFILTNCYQPVSLTEQELINFVLTVTNLFTDKDFVSDLKIEREVFQKTDLVIGLACKTMESSVIPPIDPEFEYPKKIKSIWKESLKEQEGIIPDEVYKLNKANAIPAYVGDYLLILENAIKKGFVVQAFGNPLQKVILLPNPKKYSYENKEMPAHVFFDGTKLEGKYISRKFSGIKLKDFEVRIEKPLWEMEVWQNINTDLPKNRSTENKAKIEAVIDRIIGQHGSREKYFILTNKKMKFAIEQYLDTNYPEVYVVVEYFGNLRGLNTAKNCKIGIVLGSLILPDTVDVAMAFDLVCDKFRDLPPYPLKVHRNIWQWRGSVGTKKYNDEFVEVDEFSKMHRYAEYRQALARTRYLSHPVKFYVFSKDKIDTYEPFVSQMKDDQFYSDLFPPKPKRSDNKDAEIENAVNDWLNKNGTVTVMEIHENYEIGRHTVGKYLQQMLEEGKIFKVEGYSKRYRGVVM